MKTNQLLIKKEDVSSNFFGQRIQRIVILISLLITLFNGLVIAQDELKAYYWVAFKDKIGTAYRIDRPKEFLSQRAIDRRNRQHIAIDETDLPVSKVYLDSLSKLGAEIFHTSKWLNGATIRTSDTILIKQINSLSFVDSIQFTRPANILKSAQLKFQEESVSIENTPEDYNASFEQLSQLNGQFLHNQGFRGKGIHIAVIDAGYWHVNEIAAFDSLRNSGRLLGTRDFVNPNSNIFQEHWHGMSVLSCMAANIPGLIIGTAPDASYYLFRTEQDPESEYIIEEDNWVAAAELADSLGADVINSSLGYDKFDDPKMDHTYSEFNGETTRPAKCANMAFQKGILVFNSAGNEGHTEWLYIKTPSDSKHTIAVAAVNKDGARAFFSSVGPAAGGAIKPNVAARGLSTYLINGSGVPGYSNGTSFASPVLAGLGACLLQANPYVNVNQVKLAIEQSGNQYTAPDSLLGYGIPDFEKADQFLKTNSARSIQTESGWIVSPNPFNDYLQINNQDQVTLGNCKVSIFNLQGNRLFERSFSISNQILLDNLSDLPKGIFIMSIRSGGKEQRLKIIKTH